MLSLILTVALCSAGEREDFVAKAKHEIIRRRSTMSEVKADMIANEIWDASQAANNQKWFRYPHNPRWLVVSGCLEGNWSNEVSYKLKENAGKKAPISHWSVGFFHLRIFPWITDAEALGVGYRYPIVEYVLDHPKQQVWVATRFQSRWLDHCNGDVVWMVETYRYGSDRRFNGRSEYYKDFSRIYADTWGEPVQKTVDPF